MNYTAADVKKLRDETGARRLNRLGGTLETVFVLLFIARDDSAMRKRRRIDCDDLGDNRPGAALGAFDQEVGPAIGDPMARSIVC